VIYFKDIGLDGYSGTEVNGDLYYVDEETGELVPAIFSLNPAGTVSYTPQSQRRYKRRKELERKRAEEAQQKRYYKNLNKELGDYYFAEAQDIRKELSAQSVARLIFLGTFLRYDSDLLYISERSPLTKKKLQSVMRLSEKTFYRFWTEVTGKYLSETPEGNVRVEKAFFRGSMKNKHSNGILPCHYQKIYIAALRELYYRTPPTKHRYLGYIFSILPYVNWEFNILTKNPEETDLDKLELLSLDELCEMLNYDKTQRLRLIEAYKQLTFEWDGKQQRFLSFVTDDLKHGSYKIFVNPHIMYCGNDWKRVEVLGAFF